MQPELELDDQGNPIDPPAEGKEEGKSLEEGGGEGTEGADPETFNIGGKDYTADQIKEMEEKALGYDPLLKDYTQKSQKLSEFEKGHNKEKTEEPTEEPAYLKKGWVPKDYTELQDALRDVRESGSKAALKVLQKLESDKVTAKAVVDDFVKEVKTGDKEFDEDDFFEYAQKHKFPISSVESLKSVYSSYKETREASGQGAKRAKEEIIKRKGESISGPKGSGKGGFSVPIQELRRSGSAVEAVQNVLEKNK